MYEPAVYYFCDLSNDDQRDGSQTRIITLTVTSTRQRRKTPARLLTNIITISGHGSIILVSSTSPDLQTYDLSWVKCALIH